MNRRAAPSPTIPRIGLADLARTALLILVGGLVTITWLSPTEGAINGDTVPRAIVWMLAASAWLMLAPLAPASGERVGVRGRALERRIDQGASSGEHAAEHTAPSPYPSPPKTGARGPEKKAPWWAQPTRLADLGVALFIGGHVLSGLIVLATTGQKRFAANLLAEWLGLGCAWIVLREVAAVPEWRARLTTTLLAIAIAAAGLGIWQHQVTLPHMAKEFGPKIAAVREAIARGETHPFVRDLAAAGVPTSEPGLTLYEKRLRDSREPFALFALANTLGGLLASALVLATVFLIRDVRPRSSQWWLGTWACALMAICVILTKSRTASIATVVGLMAVGYHALRQRGWSASRMIAWGGAGLAAMVLIAASAFAVGVWDREVLAEAPKSLGYRWLYWQGTARLIAERPVLGVGLGQFRPAYLRVKLPEASEEIADPHNVVLEAWVNGGLVAVLGLLLCAAALLRRVGCAHHSSREDATWWAQPTLQESSNARGGWGVIGGGALAFVAILAAGWDDAVVVMALGWAIAVAVWTGLVSPRRDDFGTQAALMTLGVHLLAAGGSGMPAVLLYGLVLLAMSVTDSPPRPMTGLLRRVAGVLPALLAGLVTLFIWRPDAECRGMIAAGDAAMQRGQIDSAGTSYDLAIDRDPWNPEPAARLAEHQQRKADHMLDPPRRLAILLDNPGIWEIASQRDPANGHWDHEIGESWRHVAPLLRQPEDIREAAADSLQRAWRKSPTNSAWAADWAEAALQAQRFDDARRAAEIALQQDDLNRRLGHVERWLPDARRTQLEDIVAKDSSSQPRAPARD